MIIRQARLSLCATTLVIMVMMMMMMMMIRVIMRQARLSTTLARTSSMSIVPFAAVLIGTTCMINVMIMMMTFR